MSGLTQEREQSAPWGLGSQYKGKLAEAKLPEFAGFHADVRAA